VSISYSNVQGSGGSGGSGGGNIDSDPLFVDPDGADDEAGTLDDDLRLSTSSPCIDAANNDLVPMDITTDLDGHPRLVDDPFTDDTGLGDCLIVDMGAYEYQDGPTECCGDCPTDVNDDDNTGPFDLAMLLGTWGPIEDANCLDSDRNGTIDAFDLAVLLGAWGPCA
jgi:hypothetical protein